MLRLLEASYALPAGAAGAAGPCIQGVALPACVLSLPRRALRLPGGARPQTHAVECPESALEWRRCPKRAWRARGGPTGQPPEIQARTSYVILPRPRPHQG